MASTFFPLHGTLPAAEQDRALSTGARRRVVVATDIAESSVTVEGVTIVIDSGLARRPAFDPASGLSRLRTITTSRASADQRAGRAGRTAPGVAYRLWSESEHLGRRAWPDPEIAGADLAPLALELAVWGAPVRCAPVARPASAGCARGRSLPLVRARRPRRRPPDRSRASDARASTSPETRPDGRRGPCRRPPGGRAPRRDAFGTGHRPARWAGFLRERGRRGAPRCACRRRLGLARGRRRSRRNGAPPGRRAAPARQVVGRQQSGDRSRSTARSRLPRPDRAVAWWWPLSDCATARSQRSPITTQ